MNPKYKIIKKSGPNDSLDRFLVYRKGWFFWKLIDKEWTLKEAEQRIASDKKLQASLKKKPELIGYY